MLSDLCGSTLLLGLPDDVLAIIARSLSPKDVCNLGLTCRDLHAVVSSDKVWLVQCDKLGLVPCSTLIGWREGVCSYKALCCFLVNVNPLLGVWVHQNPELGNVVYVMPGFLSVVGCRIIPQEVGPLGLEEGPILWAPVFEILCDYEGSTAFLLHGRERGSDYVYPGMLKSVDRTCNVLFLEVEPCHRMNGGKLAYSKSFALDKEVQRKLSRTDNGISKSQRIVGQKEAVVSFNRLGFGDRRRLLDIVTCRVRINSSDSSNELLFPSLRNGEVELQQDVAVLCERRSQLLKMYRHGGQNLEMSSNAEPIPNPIELGSREILQGLDCSANISQSRDEDQAHNAKGKTLSGILRNGLKQILGKSNSMNRNHEQPKKSSSVESKHVQLHEFLRAVQTLKAGREFAGLWGGTFGWPPGKPSEDKPGKALFFILISYEESQGQELLIATKILEGTSYVLHPNGSAMFIVNISQPSTDIFPWDIDGDSNPVYVTQSFKGEGIANGYGFRYPGSKPGSLFAIQNGWLVFMWKESRAVLNLKRLNLPQLLRKGERVPSLTPVSNFAYLTKTYSNVFSGFSNSSNGLSSPRHNFS